MLLRVWSTIALVTACLALPQAADMGQESNIASAILSWLLRLREQALRLILSSPSCRHFLPPTSDLLLAEISKKPPAMTELAFSIADVPRAHFVAFGSGGVLPDFEGPFSVDIIYRNKRWGDTVYFAVWSGYYENRKVTVGVDARTTYSDICQFLQAEESETGVPKLLRLTRRLWHFVPRVYEHATHAIVKRVLIFSDRYLGWLLGPRTATILFYWLNWLLWLNTVRGLCMPWQWLWRGLWRWPKARTPQMQQRTSTHELVPRSIVYFSLCSIDTIAALIFASPASIARASVFAASLACVPVHASVLSAAYLGHRLAVLERCGGMRRCRA